MKYTIGSLVIVAGILIIMKTEWILENFGSIPWAEQHLGTEGGSRIMYKFIGLAAIILSVMAMTGLLGEIILNVFGPFSVSDNNSLSMEDYPRHSGNVLLDPWLLLQKSHLQEGMRVADFGCGRTGQIVFAAATILKNGGMVYAVDIMKDSLMTIRNEAAMRQLENVHTVWSDVEKVGHTAIPEHTIDIVFLVNILLHAADRNAMLEEAARLLRDKGRLVVVDWSEEHPLLQLRSHTLVNFDHLFEWADEHDFALQEDFVAGKAHRGLVLYRHL